MKNIKVLDLKVEFGSKKILEKVNLEFNWEELTVIIGLNGAGKTTFLKTLAGLLKYKEGKIFYGLNEIKNISNKEKAKIISYVPQKIELSFNYKVTEFIKMGMTPYSDIFGNVKNENIKIEEALNYLNISYLKDRLVNELSGGELKLVYLARNRVQKTPWMILDEPSSSLDFKREHEFLKKMKEYMKENKVGAIMSLHNPSIAKIYADRIIVINKGKIIEDIVKKDELFYEKLKISFTKIYGEEITKLI